HRPDDVEPEPAQEVQVVQQEVDADEDEDGRPEVFLAPGHARPILEARPETLVERSGDPGGRDAGDATSSAANALDNCVSEQRLRGPHELTPKALSSWGIG